MKKLNFESYQRPNGHDEFIEWLSKLPDKDQAKLLLVIDESEEKGLLIARKMQWVKKLENNLFELRSKVSTNIQRALYFHAEGDTYVITHGFTKKTQKTPTKEKEHAKIIRKEWENENR